MLKVIPFIFLVVSNLIPLSVYSYENKCIPIGIILKSDSSSTSPRPICKNESLSLESKSLIACRYSHDFKWLNSGTYKSSTICPNRRHQLRRCEIQRNCFRETKGIQLLGRTFGLSNSMPEITWSPVPEATKYEIFLFDIEGNKLLQFQTDYVSFNIPPLLEYGGFYRLEIKPVGIDQQGIFTLFLPGKEQFEELQDIISIIQDSEISDSDKAIYIDAAYMRIGLLPEAIQSLENSPVLQSSNELQRILGNRYLEAGYIDKAQDIFYRLDRAGVEESKTEENT